LFADVGRHYYNLRTHTDTIPTYEEDELEIIIEETEKEVDLELFEYFYVELLTSLVESFVDEFVADNIEQDCLPNAESTDNKLSHPGISMYLSMSNLQNCDDLPPMRRREDRSDEIHHVAGGIPTTGLEVKIANSEPLRHDDSDSESDTSDSSSDSSKENILVLVNDIRKGLDIVAFKLPELKHEKAVESEAANTDIETKPPTFPAEEIEVAMPEVFFSSGLQMAIIAYIKNRLEEIPEIHSEVPDVETDVKTEILVLISKLLFPNKREHALKVLNSSSAASISSLMPILKYLKACYPTQIGLWLQTLFQDDTSVDICERSINGLRNILDPRLHEIFHSSDYNEMSNLLNVDEVDANSARDNTIQSDESSVAMLVAGEWQLREKNEHEDFSKAK